eukprot:890515_1
MLTKSLPQRTRNKIIKSNLVEKRFIAIFINVEEFEMVGSFEIDASLQLRPIYITTVRIPTYIRYNGRSAFGEQLTPIGIDAGKDILNVLMKKVVFVGYHGYIGDRSVVWNGVIVNALCIVNGGPLSLYCEWIKFGKQQKQKQSGSQNQSLIVGKPEKSENNTYTLECGCVATRNATYNCNAYHR